MSELLNINVNNHVEKKNGLSYLSWAWAWAEVLKIDSQATWEAHEYNGIPVIVMPDGTCMVKVSVTIKGHTKSCLLPVMNHRNQAIEGPDSFAINTAIVRCLTKAIGMHGLGLYIYAGEDLPEEESKSKIEAISPAKEAAKLTPIAKQQREAVDAYVADIRAAWEDGQEMAVLNAWRSIDDNDIRIHVWSELKPDSKIRTFINANRQQAKEAA